MLGVLLNLFFKLKLRLNLRSMQDRVTVCVCYACVLLLFCVTC